MVKQPSTKTDWEDAALGAIAGRGLEALAIPELARSLGVTKGSFYWHFRGIQELVDASLRRWEEIDQEALDEVRRIRDPRARLTALFLQSMEKRQAHELFVTLSGSSSRDVAKTLRRLSERRVHFLVDAYRELGLALSDARAQATLAYSAYVGAVHLRHQRAPGLGAEKEIAAFVAHAVKTLIPRRKRVAK